MSAYERGNNNDKMSAVCASSKCVYTFINDCCHDASNSSN